MEKKIETTLINKPPPFKGLTLKIPIIILIKGRGFSDHRSTLGEYYRAF